MTITSLRYPPGRVWGILALVAAALPLPWLFVLNVLSVVVRNSTIVPGSPSSEEFAYGLIAAAGLLFFPVFFLAALVFGIIAVTKPRIAGKVMGWIAIAIVILAIPALWFGYLVWIINS